MQYKYNRAKFSLHSKIISAFYLHTPYVVNKSANIATIRFYPKIDKFAFCFASRVLNSSPGFQKTHEILDLVVCVCFYHNVHLGSTAKAPPICRYGRKCEIASVFAIMHGHVSVDYIEFVPLPISFKIFFVLGTVEVQTISKIIHTIADGH